MLTSFGPSPSAQNDGPGLHHLQTIAPLRIGAGLVLFFLYALEGSVRSYQLIWKHTPWDMIETLHKAGVPAPHILGPIAAGIAVLVAIFWTIGFLTRLFSVIFLPVLIGALVVVERLNAESQAGVCWLFLFITVTLILFGSGMLSADALFRFGFGGGSNRKSSRY